MLGWEVRLHKQGLSVGFMGEVQSEQGLMDIYGKSISGRGNSQHSL